MISHRTTFILGAGASIPFGYPSGVQLRNVICRELTDDRTPHAQTLLQAGFTWAQIKDFRDALFFSGKYSVDAFLEHRTEFIQIGKMAIAIALIPHEVEERLFENLENNWCAYLFKSMNCPFADFEKNPFSVITFNYDRSFEHFLFTALKNSSGKSDEACADKIKSIPIVHVYGNLNDLPWQRDKGRAYKFDASVDEIKKSAEKIQIIHETAEGNPYFVQAHELLKKSEKIVFLGFGYDQTNMNRLKIMDFRGKNIMGTICGLPESEIAKLNSYTERCFGLVDKNAVEFLKHYSL